MPLNILVAVFALDVFELVGEIFISRNVFLELNFPTHREANQLKLYAILVKQ